MSLGSLITTAKLRALSYTSYERGAQYFRDGNVTACEVRGEVIEGVVEGGEAYRVRVFEHGRQLQWECTCPVDSMMCKHAVALCLSFLSGAARPAEEAPPRPVEKKKKAAAVPFATIGEATAWARAHSVEHELDTPALVVMADVAAAYANPTGLHYMLARLTLRDIAALDVVERYLGVRQVQLPSAEAARVYLEQAAADVQVAIAEEGARPQVPALGASIDGVGEGTSYSAGPDGESAIRALWTRLLSARRDLRASAMPRSREARRRGDLTFDHAALAFVWNERLLERSHVHGVGVVAARLTLTPRLATSCACKRPACTHVIALIDAALDLLQRADRRTEARTIAEEMTRPGWQRALAAMAAIDEKKAVVPTEIEVWWEIDEVYGGPQVAAVVKKALKKGGMSSGSRVSAEKLLHEYGAVLSETDTKVAEHIVGHAEAHRSATYPSRAFAALVGHPRVRLVNHDEPVRVLRFPLGFSALPAGGEIRLEPAVDGARFSPRLLEPLLSTFAPGEPLLVVEPEHGRVLLIDVSDDARALWNTLAKHGEVFPPEAHEQLLTQLGKLEQRLPLSMPDQLKGARHAEQLAVVVRVRLTPEDALELEAFVRPAPGAGVYAPATGPRDVMVVHDGRRGYVRRDLTTELERVQAMLARLPLEDAEEGPPGVYNLYDPDAALGLVAVLQKPMPGLEAEWVDKKQNVVGVAGPRGLRLTIERRNDWFGIDGTLVVDQARLELATLLDTVRRQRKFVRVDADRWLELSDELRRRLTAIADQTYSMRKELEISPGAVPAIREAEAAGVEVQQAPQWAELAQKLVSSTKLRPKPPASLAEILRPYQIEGHAWLTRVAAWGAGACLADDMGLGKTIQAIAMLIDRAKKGPALVLAPTTVTLNWVDELKRFAPNLRPVSYGDNSDRTSVLRGLKKGDVLIASYGLLHRDIDALAVPVFATLVLDEAQALKNYQTQRSKAARRLQAEMRIALSGTPIENSLSELWSLFAVVFPGLLGSWDQFRDRYAFPIERQQSAAARESLSRVIKPFLLRRTKAEVAQELPSRTEIEVPISLSTEELQMYEDARLAAVAVLAKQVDTKKKEGEQRFAVLAALTRLRLLASHPKLHDATSPVASSKMQRLLELLDELRTAGHRALVFSQFTSHLALVKDELTNAGVSWLYLDGATPTKERKQLVDRFQKGEGDVFLISLKAGGTGINLTAADYVIHLDPWWNPAVEDQATDRAHRIGQTKPVTVYRLIARGTVEERMLKMHHGKRALVAGILDGTDAAAKLTTRDLMELLQNAN